MTRALIASAPPCSQGPQKRNLDLIPPTHAAAELQLLKFDNCLSCLLSTVHMRRLISDEYSQRRPAARAAISRAYAPARVTSDSYIILLEYMVGVRFGIA